jgi:NodT family efflux transporter outer membrane factor (OMF) lipoprotein
MVLFALVLFGCIQGPNYQRPSVEAPQTWEAVASRDSGPSHPAIRISRERAPEARWWRAFNNEELTGLIETALEKNHDVRRAAGRVMEARAVSRQTYAGLLPRITLDPGYSRTRRSENIKFAPTGGQGGSSANFAPPGSEFDLFTLPLDLSWEVDLWGKNQRAVESAEAEWQANDYDRRAVMLTLISDVGQSYFLLRALDEQIEIAEKTLALRQDTLAIVRSRFQAGLLSDLDVSRGEVEVADTAAVLPDLRRQRAQTVNRLAVLLGENPGQREFAPKPLRTVIVQPEIPVGLPSQLLERRPDIQAAERSLVSANAQIGEARAFFFPQLVITGSGGLQSSDFANWFKAGSRLFSVGPSLSLPIFEGGRNQARLEGAEARYDQAVERYRQTILQAFREVADTLVAIQTRTERRDRQQDAVASAQRALELALLRYREGLVSFLDVLDAQRTVFASETALVETESLRLADLVIIFKVLGGGWEQDAG